MVVRESEATPGPSEVPDSRKKGTRAMRMPGKEFHGSFPEGFEAIAKNAVSEAGTKIWGATVGEMVSVCAEGREVVTEGAWRPSP